MMSQQISINDDYYHEDPGLEYCLENILHEPTEKNDEFLNLKTLYNSILINNCSCTKVCETNECGHGQNYKCVLNESDTEKIILNENRLGKDLIYECTAKCKCSVMCGNRLVQYGPRKNLLIKSSKLQIEQKGLFTSEQIPKGSFICEYAGEILTRSEALKRDRILEIDRILNLNESAKNLNTSNYIMCLKESCLDNKNDKLIETFIDPSKIGNIGRYINHSCDPNCEIISVRIDCPIPKLAIFAKRNINPLEELYFHYGGGIHNSEAPNNPVKCLCRSKNCQMFLPVLNY